MYTNIIGQYGFTYDPKISGYNKTFWNTWQGSDPTISSGALVFNNCGISSFANVSGHGTYTFYVNVPVAPTSGDQRSFGLNIVGLATNISTGGPGCIRFYTKDTAFKAHIEDNRGNVLFDQAITWSSAWTAATVPYSIQIGDSGVVKFFVNNALQAEYDPVAGAVFPTFPQALMVYNNNADNMTLSALVAVQTQTLT